MGGIGIWQLVIVAVIIVLLFGTKKLRNLGDDLGSAIKGFKNAIGGEEQKNNVEETFDILDDSSKSTTEYAFKKSDTKETDKA